MSWEIKEQYKKNMILLDMNQLSSKEQDIVKQVVPDFLTKYFDEV
jgi:FixJ family two-component response regulator